MVSLSLYGFFEEASNWRLQQAEQIEAAQIYLNLSPEEALNEFKRKW